DVQRYGRPSVTQPDYEDPGIRDEAEEDETLVGWPELVGWLKRHQVTLIAVVVIAMQLAWKAAFLQKFYFRQDDFHFTELGLQYGLGWKYLTYVGSGHLHPGVLLLVWILAKAAPYHWGAATAMTLILAAGAGLACWQMLRTLIGDRLAILIPLTLYLVTPLTLPDDSWWSSAIESLPLQIAIFMAVTAHVKYVRSGRARHLVAAAFWMIFGLFFFEKAVVIPAILFGVTAGFLVEGKLAEAARRTLARYWRSWAVYGVLAAGYIAVLLATLSQSTVKPHPPSAAASLSFTWSLLGQTLVPGLLGGPWRWVLAPNAAVAYGAPAKPLVWLAVLFAGVIVAASIAIRNRAWRAWAIVAGWVLLADIAPILLGRLATVGFAQVLGLDTRYVADAAAVAALGVALAFWPVSSGESMQESASRRSRGDLFGSPAWQIAGIAVTCAIVLGSVWSMNRYEKTTALYNYVGNVYLIHAKSALSDLPPGTVIADGPMNPVVMWNIYYDRYGNQSEALAPLESAATRRNVRWATHYSGTITRMLIFTSYGTLVPAKVAGAKVAPPRGAKCARVRQGVATLHFPKAPPSFTGILRIGYLGSSLLAGRTVTVTYGNTSVPLRVESGLHSAYFSVQGSSGEVTVSNLPQGGFCLGDAEAGNLQPEGTGT
ncbi:MAG TPA: hypothetical protein VEV61_08550, partial [Streptosporangiaceae bacterium]|nr:hypothetical protein [Streptosporangiaceae bacterium]